MVRILLVEDDELNRDMLARRLARSGFEILVAVDGEEALRMASEELPDVVLLDMSLPKVDGWEVTRRLKDQGRTREIPVIALTAHAMKGDRERALASGCDEYDTKPIDLARLVAKIEQLTGPRT